MKLNKEGFITNYMIAGPKVVPYQDKVVDQNQLRYEKTLRDRIAKHSDICSTKDIKLHAMSELQEPWEYYFSYGNWFVDKSSFYSSLMKVELVAAVCLVVEEEMEVCASLWSYGAIDCWLNNQLIGRIEKPVYKPIAKTEIKLALSKGKNLVYIKMQNLGVRDTRNIFGIQLLERKEEITVTLPDEEGAKPYMEVEKWFNAVSLSGHHLTFPKEAFANTTIGYDSKSPDVTKKDNIRWVDISGQKEVELDRNNPYVILSVELEETRLERRFEILEDIKPIYLEKTTIEDNTKEIYERISDVVKLDRGEGIGFSMMNILARLEVNRFREDDTQNIYETLDQIESRMDCADFMVCALIRYMKNYEMDERLQKRAKEVLCNFRYWMDEEGADAMCFWSENHSLMFYICAMHAGEMYPEELFTRSNKTGQQLYESSRKKVIEWLLDVEEHGFEEFLSGIYMCITFIALLNTIDFSDEEIEKKATKLTDQLFYQVAIHTFQGSVIAPQGRVYRDVIYPFMQGLQSLVNLLNPKYPYSYGEGWLGFFATSKYELPTKLGSWMDEEIQTQYSSGNAFICLNKTKNYIMTSVQSPREDEGFERWKNISFEEECDVNSHEYIKSLNERFHGTTCFEPGVYGYQQHLWSAAVANDTLVFVNHPGGPCDESSMRPGYWFGNGIMPAIKQKGQAISSIYVIPENHPIDFTHIFWPSVRFEQMKECGAWLIGQKKEGYIGIWCSDKKELYQDQLFNAEYRVYGRKVAYLCICSDKEECTSLAAFMQFCEAYEPYFEKETTTLKTSNDLQLQYQYTEDKTQIV